MPDTCQIHVYIIYLFMQTPRNADDIKPNAIPQKPVRVGWILHVYWAEISLRLSILHTPLCQYDYTSADCEAKVMVRSK